MEKLQPVIKQIFWICFSLAMLLILIGWWSAKGELSTQIAARETAISTAFTEAGQNVRAVPNPLWAEGGSKFNAVHERDFQKSAMQLYERQIKARTYPRQISDELSRVKFNATIESMALRERFAQVYSSYFRDQLEVIRPFRDGKGVVDIEGADITYTTWSSKRPTSAEIWKAQEDIWLLRSIFDSIATVNRGYDLISKAPIRGIELLQLRGGDRNAPIGGAGGTAGGFGDMGEEMFSEGGFGGPGVGVAGGSGAYAAFEGSLTSDLLSEEFGSVAGAGGMMGGMMGEDSFSDGGFGGDAAEPQEEDRYVDDDETLPYRTRAFALNVKMLQEDIPALLGELTNSYFPVEIVRVDIAFSTNKAAGTSSLSGGYGEEFSGEDFNDGMGGGMTGGMTGGFGGGFGGGGFGSPGLGGGLGGSPLAAPKKRGRKPLTAKQQKAVTQGERFRKAGLSDPNLCTLRVAGLMTLYRSPAENEAEAETAAAAEQETQEAGVGGEDVAPLDANPLEEAMEGESTPEEGTSSTEETTDPSATTTTPNSDTDGTAIEPGEPAAPDAAAPAPADTTNEPAATTTDSSD